MADEGIHMAEVAVAVPPLVNAAAQMVAAPMGNAGVVNPLSDPTSAFYLHPGESPDLYLVSSLLTESNYHTWSHAVIVALMQRINWVSLMGACKSLKLVIQ